MYVRNWRLGIKHGFSFRDRKDRKGAAYRQNCRNFWKIKGLGGGISLPIDQHTCILLLKLRVADICLKWHQVCHAMARRVSERLTVVTQFIHQQMHIC